jgi:hypothetical protein
MLRHLTMRKLTFLVAFLVPLTVLAQPVQDELASGFVNPPQIARPRTWWHWMNGCVSREGITADLEAMKRVGIGGAWMFNVDQLPIDDPSVRVLNPKWRELMKFSIEEAARLGLEFGIHNDPGWSSSGGPWVKVEDSMQKVVWSQRLFTGPSKFEDKLEQPQVDRRWNYYRDIAVIAVKAEGEAPVAQDQVIDLTGKHDADGTLTWDAPAGQWTIIRFGHTTTGRENRTAPQSGRGLECDKLRKPAAAGFWEGYPAKVLEDAGPHVGKTLTKMLIDSYEAGPQDWTPLMLDEFRKRRGYDPIPWLPVLAKRVIGSEELTFRFRCFWVRTISVFFIYIY